ncbi:uncharacterized protein BDR25DRAFT_343429 [Lindgomyces ingoldianus]|uniref:Uncharacterized protein n=1 Tax=Lindgomyces ingoldianus TaxID=673940 RepID=A0ACB6QTC8_9PLEO|nr:uncharacterized protein BDR25DRAFT_343429 [Lindgomyces ingoldianus]KAF2470249.1 hypothetical protein BDR25DRAFT_343429 [Lindgomyces ingoldianus]
MADERDKTWNQSDYVRISSRDIGWDTGGRSVPNPFIDTDSLNEHRSPTPAGDSHQELSDLTNRRSRSFPKAQDETTSAVDRDIPTIYSRKSNKIQIQWCTNFGWWGEVASLSLGIFSVVSILHMLSTIDNKPLSDWKYMEPNSLAAAYSTIIKASILYPVAQCIGQLKWIYFENPKQLSLLQTFDDASRSPWGAAVLLWKTKGTALVASTGALITITILAFDLFTQRSISFTTRSSVLRNETGYLTNTQAWLDPSSMLPIMQNDSIVPVSIQGLAYYPLSQSMLAIMSDQPFELTNAKCPAPHCKAPDYESLAVCATCDTQTISSESFSSCSYNLKGSGKDQNFTSINNLRTRLKEIGNNSDLNITGRCGMVVEKTPDPLLYGHDANLTIQWYFFNGLIGFTHIESASNGSKPQGEILGPAIGFQTSQLQSCNSETNWGVLHGQATLDRKEGNYSSTSLQTYHCFNSTTDLMLWNDVSKIGEINGTSTRCRLNLCAQQYRDVRISLNRSHSQTTNKILKRKSRDQTRSRYSTEDNPSVEYLIDEGARKSLIDITTDIWKNKLLTTTLSMGGERINPGNWTNRFNRLAAALSTVIQGPSNPDAKNFTIEAYGDVIYVEVRWCWMILPLSTTILTVIFFASTVIRSTRKPYLFKSSILALLIHGLEGWDVSSGEERFDSTRVTESKLLVQAESITATLQRNEGGIWKLRTE